MSSQPSLWGDVQVSGGEGRRRAKDNMHDQEGRPLPGDSGRMLAFTLPQLSRRAAADRDHSVRLAYPVSA
jgi:hypothetical protein